MGCSGISSLLYLIWTACYHRKVKSEASLIRWFFGQSMVRFAGVGLVSTTADILVLNALYPAVTTVYVATALGFLTGLTVGFLLNGRYVFQVDRTGTRYLKYGLISLLGLFYTEVIIHFLYKEWALTTALGAKLVAVFAVFFWNYFTSKRWAFR